MGRIRPFFIGALQFGQHLEGQKSHAKSAMNPATAIMISTQVPIVPI